MYLEQYEDTLNNIVFRSLDKTIQETLHGFKDYFLKYMLDYETRESPIMLSSEKFIKPFECKIKEISGSEERIVNVDLLETFNYLLGLKVEKIIRFDNKGCIYRTVFGKSGGKNTIIIWRDLENLDLEKDRAFIQGSILSGKEADIIFVNGDSYIEGAKLIEPEFKKLMGIANAN